MNYPPSDTLIAAFKDKEDFNIACEQGWYRIPVKSQISYMIEAGRVQYISFYFKKIFNEWKYSVRHVAKVTRIEKQKRKDLFPMLKTDSKANVLYYKICFDKLYELPNPIISHRGRRILFIPTTLYKLKNASEINDVFADSPLEDMLWAELKKNKLTAERQYYLQTNDGNWICDFAFFCKNGTIDVECDGDAYHMQPEQVIYDKSRNNEITAVANWAVLRFTTKHLQENMNHTILTIKRKIDKFGGLHYAQEDEYRYVSKSDNQLRLFDY